MNSAAEKPQHLPLIEAAKELCASHHIGSAALRVLPVIALRGPLSHWLVRIAEVCSEPKPEASKAAEWLLDNRYQVKRALRQIEEDLPHAFYKRLPRLSDSELKGIPRIFAIAKDFLTNTHLQLSMNQLVQFIGAYQEDAPLTIAELWALPTMLRIAYVEMLVSATAELFPEMRTPAGEVSCGTVEISHDPTECIARAISGLRIVATVPWKDFFDRTSLVEKRLQSDPAAVYPRMDFDTRDQYRKTVEELARGSGLSELEVAEYVLEQARKSKDDTRQYHVGFWLFDDGRRRSETATKYRPQIRTMLRRLVLNHPGLSYATALFATGATALVIPLLYLWSAGAGPLVLIGGAALTIMPASIIAITVVHWTVTLIVPPRVLPKLDFEKGIPDEFRVAVVLPVIIGKPSEVVTLLEKIELHRIANPDPGLRFVLLSDPKDAAVERLPQDDELEDALVSGIRRLNDKYGRYGMQPFHLLHRSRHYNPCERCWMAWERKRGKLEEFNLFVLGRGKGSFSLHEGDTSALHSTRFVVTVDADTVLPIGAVSRLVGILAHPLNKAEFARETGNLCAGYTVIQPRMEIVPETDGQTLFSRIYAGDNAIDIYSRAVSNVYQDLFGSAVYVGKGIYDVAAFHRCLDNRVPENSLLSHDLFEGAQGRTALASDVVFYDAFPSGYIEYTWRWHRWVRGDWQLLPWLFPGPRAASKDQAPVRLSGLDRWKIFDNLRRSLIPLALVLLVVSGWTVMPGSPWIWTILTVAAPAAYLFTDVITGLARGYRRGVLQSTMRQFAAHVARWFLAVVYLLYDAIVAADAIVRTLWRLYVSRRNLLTWTSAAHVAAQIADNRARNLAWSNMWMAPALAVLIAILVLTVRLSALPEALPLLLLWIASPELAAWISRTRTPQTEQLNAEDRHFLRRTARRTWLYFESFVGPGENWLPPDNFQEVPRPEIAHRTSPTNIGMYLLSTLTAWDLGYVDTLDLAVRIQNTLNALKRLERYRGHFLNWYDSRTIEPLEPRYVSTVDSGNLAVCFVTLKQGCQNALNAPILRRELWVGLVDTLEQLSDALKDAGALNEEVARTIQTIKEHAVAGAECRVRWREVHLNVSRQPWSALNAAVTRAVSSTPAPAPSPDALNNAQIWLERVKHHLHAIQITLGTMFPWAVPCDTPPPKYETIASRLLELLDEDVSLSNNGQLKTTALKVLREADEPQSRPEGEWLDAVSEAIESGFQAQDDLRSLFEDNAACAEEMAYQMNFAFLYDSETRLFCIGYNVSSDRLDPHYYDLLASEARIASYFAIAKHDVPVEHWFSLGRPITKLSGVPSLLSWNGSMFEFLMPSLLLRSSTTTLLARSERAAVEIQRRFARESGVPWGISESGFASRGANQEYNYRAFGVPGLGLRRGLAQDLVVAPYASGLALAVDPGAAIENLRRLARMKFTGLYGFIEAGDFTPDRVLPGPTPFVPIRAYMAHHQGMLLAAIGNALANDLHVHRFSTDMRMRTVELLLQERIPTELPPELVGEEEPIKPRQTAPAKPPPRPWRPKYMEWLPQMHLLGNGRMASWISEAGSGGLFWHWQSLTRWHSDAVCDDSGLWIYLHEQETGATWSAGRQPAGEANDYSVTFYPQAAEFHRRDFGLATRMEVVVAPNDDLEIRRITVVNETDRPRIIRVTSYGEVVLAPSRDDERHPAFSKLFVTCRHVESRNGLLFTRRPRGANERPPTLFHYAVFDNQDEARLRFEADRRTFLGRFGDLRRPRGAINPLTGTLGNTLDPIMALQFDIYLQPNEPRQFAFITIASGSSDSALELSDRFATMSSLDWAFRDAAHEAAHEANALSVDSKQLQEFQALASLLLAPQASSSRGEPTAMSRLDQSRLWALGISGDLPILLVRLHDEHSTEFVRELLRAMKLWSARLFSVDLVIVRSGISSYEEPVRDRVLSLVREAGLQERVGGGGGIHLLFRDRISAEDNALLEASACALLNDTDGPLAQQISRPFSAKALPPLFVATAPQESFSEKPERESDALEFDNGYGGFTEDGTEYVIRLETGSSTPAPWSNILANDQFGTLLTESGGGFTWSLNSGEHRLTPWTNDPVTDAPSECVYLRDEESGKIWTPTPEPAGAENGHRVRHGAGYTSWSSRSQGLDQELTIFVAPNDPIKVARLRLTDLTNRQRRVTATYYAEWLLGSLRSVSKRHVKCRYDPQSHAVLAKNSWNAEFAGRVAFLGSNLTPHSITTDRRDFIGREGDLRQPVGLLRWDLGGCVSPESEPCAAFQVHLDVAPGASAEVLFFLGEDEDEEKAKALLARWRKPNVVDRAMDELRGHWDQLLGAVQVRTPDPAFDLMINRWLSYQTISSRISARAGFYQANGAIGFRDQLQDVLLCLYSDPARARAHILDCAARQFEEGDVLHWWHPPSSRGVRTRCSDDLLWLPFVASKYVTATGDNAILNEMVPFLRAPELGPHDDDRYALFEPSAERHSLFEHCLRALERGVTHGSHGLPLMGSGDWNDGMNRIGADGKGESVWLAWFAAATIDGFSDLARRTNQTELADHWKTYGDKFRDAVDATAWDGNWYLRAFDDAGHPLGSSQNDECRIDSISQSWAAIAHGHNSKRTHIALDEVENELISEEDRLIRLLRPPFAADHRDPGYIKAYPAGIRENGGQYSHAAAWVGHAFAAIGDGDRAYRIFDILNPIRRTETREDTEHYRAEPYVLAADIASEPPHTGKAGWTWYTGAAAWTWRLGVESILGLNLENGNIKINPCLPKSWGRVEATLNRPGGTLAIIIEDPEHLGHGELEISIDGEPVREKSVSFPADGSTRQVQVRLVRKHRQDVQERDSARSTTG